MTVVAAADLDRTLIYSARAVGMIAAGGSAGAVDPSDLVCVEHYDSRPASFLTRTAAADLAALGALAELVPVTTRTVAQLARVRLPGPRPHYAVAANGGVLLVHGVPDVSWTAHVTDMLRAAAPVSQVFAELERRCRPRWTRSLRIADGLFCYAVVERDALPEDFMADVTTWTATLGWRTSLQGRKLYWVPVELTKSAAVSEIARREDACCVLGAGDSLLDIDLLERADRGIHPAHGEIFDSGWSAPHVERTVASGALAGQEIAAWLLAGAAGCASSRNTDAPG